jgi:hypothetical protein
MTKLQRGFVGLLLLIALVAGGAALLKSGTYGFTIFVVAPVIIGALASWVVRPSTAKQAAGVGTLATLLATFSWPCLWPCPWEPWEAGWPIE